MAQIRTDDGLFYPNDIRLSMPRIDNSDEATPMLNSADFFVKFTNAATTSFVTNPATSVGTVYVKNSTGADFVTGDFQIPNGRVWMLLFDGTEWTSLQGV